MSLFLSEEFSIEQLFPFLKEQIPEKTQETESLNLFDSETETKIEYIDINLPSVEPLEILDPTEELSTQNDTVPKQNPKVVHQEYHKEMTDMVQNMSYSDYQEPPKKKRKEHLSTAERSKKTFLSLVLNTEVYKKKEYGVAIKKGEPYQNCHVMFDGNLFRAKLKNPKLEVLIRECKKKDFTFTVGSFQPSSYDQGVFTFIFDLLLPKKITGVTNGRPFEMGFRLVDEDKVIYQELFPTVLMGFEMQKYKIYTTKNFVKFQNYQGNVFKY